MKKKLTFIVGPTASGKTDYALREASRHKAAILSCDSLCVYKGMDIGTAKPTPQEQAVAPHFGLDLVAPDTAYSVSCYIAYRDRILEQLWQQRQPVVVVGGSGFYLKSFFSPVMDELDIPQSVTRQVEAVRKASGPAGLLQLLQSCNPPTETFAGLDRENPRRVEKALIRCLCSGKSYSQLREEFLALPAPLEHYEKQVLLISRPAEELRERNRKRVRQMLETGLIEEVMRLRAEGFENNPSASNAIGYREVLSFLDGQISERELEEQIYIHTNQLMRKQRTWFRHQIPVHRTVEGTLTDY